MYIELYVAKRKPIMAGRRRSRQENNIKMDLEKVECGWRMEPTDCLLHHRLRYGVLNSSFLLKLRLLYVIESTLNPWSKS